MLMSNKLFHLPGKDSVRTLCALVAAALLLPALAYAEADHGKDSNGQNKGNLYSRGDRDKDDGHWFGQKDHPKVPAVPEANTGWVLLPIAGAILLFSWRQLARAKA
jgi:hypothetical protein